MEKKPEKSANKVTPELLLQAAKQLAELSETLEAQASIMKSLEITDLETSNWDSSGDRGIVLLERATKAISTSITDQKIKQERAKKLLSKINEVKRAVKNKGKSQEDGQ